MANSHPTFPNPTIHEALCEMHFAVPEGIEWDRSIYGRFFNRIRDEYPTPEPSTSSSAQIRYSHRTRDMVLQLSDHQLTVNVLEYPGWEQFQSDILNAWTWLREVVGPLEVTRVGLRYINIIRKSSPEEAVKEWLAGSEYVAAAFLKSPEGHSTIRLQANENKRLSVTVANTTAKFSTDGTSEPVVILDIDCIAEQLQDGSAELPSVLTPLHELAWQVFDSFRSPKLNAYLNQEEV